MVCGLFFQKSFGFNISGFFKPAQIRGEISLCGPILQEENNKSVLSALWRKAIIISRAGSWMNLIPLTQGVCSPVSRVIFVVVAQIHFPGMNNADGYR
jgi:hypothetical protein